MIKILTDTSTLYNKTTAEKIGLGINNLIVTIKDKSYKEFEEINSSEFIDIINEGHVPKSSQPSIGDVVETYSKNKDHEMINICMASGLSGTYEAAVAAVKMTDDEVNVHVINSHTLCGPHKFMVDYALDLVKNGFNAEHIIDKVTKLTTAHRSYLIPMDFGYLRRGGRLSPLVSYVGQAGLFTPVMTQDESYERLVVSAVKRSFKQAIKAVSEKLDREFDINSGKVKLYVSHANNLEKANEAVKELQSKFNNIIIDILELSPAFITQGGPGCIAIQAIDTSVIE